ncbi:hypothetical protein [Streptomyces sp. NPDC020747]|uniref:hypothetical protein n=1 Tax=Streptomyces sp. NPDC020747 TaxID=3365086 RepID=UPI00378A0701
MPDVLTWTVQQRLALEGRAELLRKELSGIESQLARLEAAEVVFGQWAEATDGGRRSSGIVEPEPERVVAGPGAGGMRLVPDRSEGMGVESLTSEYRRIMEIVTGADGPVMAKDVAGMLGRELTPGKIEPVRGQLRKLAGPLRHARTSRPLGLLRGLRPIPHLRQTTYLSQEPDWISGQGSDTGWFPCSR